MKKNKYQIHIFIGIITILGLIFVLVMTPQGVGVSADSTIYLSGAKNMQLGRGFSLNNEPITRFPPLYSSLVAFVSLFNLGLIESARIINACLFGINIGLVTYAVYLSSDRNFILSTLAALFVFSSAPLFKLHLWAWSEPLFVSFMLAGIILFCGYLNQITPLFLYISSLAIGASILTRYIGGAFLACPLLIIFMNEKFRKLIRRIYDGIVWLLLATMPLLLVAIRNTMFTSANTYRRIIFHPLSAKIYIIKIMTNFINFLAPISLPNKIRPLALGLIAVLIIIMIFLFFKNHHKNINWRSMEIVMPLTCSVMIFSYLLFLYVSLSFFDANTPVDWRILSPVFILLVIGGFPAVWVTTKAIEKKILRWLFIVIIGSMIAIKTLDFIKTVKPIQDSNLGFASEQWMNSESVEFIRSTEKEIKIYSNGANVLAFLTDNRVPYYQIPVKYNPATTQVNPKYFDQMEIMCKEVHDNGALLVFFFSESIQRDYLPNQEELDSFCRMPVYREFPDSIVFFSDLEKT